MTEFANPPILKSQPADGQILQYELATDRWIPVSAASVGALIVPQTHIAAAAVPTAESASAVVAADAATQTGSYVQADVQSIRTLANANKVGVNELVTDVGTLVTELTATNAKLSSLLTELQTAGVLASS